MVDMKGLHSSAHTDAVNYSGRIRERGGTWGLYLLLSFGERSWITNVRADGFSLYNDSLDMLVRNNGGEAPLAASLTLRCVEAGWSRPGVGESWQSNVFY